MKASFFDVDGTLVRTNLVHPTWFYLTHQRSPWTSLARMAKTVMRAPALALAERADRRLFNEALFEAYAGMSHDRLHLLADEAYEQVLQPAIFPHARDLVTRSVDEGHRVVLVSGALDFLMQRLAHDLGAHDVIANTLEFQDGHATGRLLPPVVAGPEKAALLRRYAQTHGYDLGQCHAYSDSYSDVPMLSVVGHPAVVNPDAHLRTLAATYQWPVLDLRASP